MVTWVLKVQLLLNVYGFQATVKLKSYKWNNCKSGTICTGFNSLLTRTLPCAFSCPHQGSHLACLLESVGVGGRELKEKGKDFFF